MKIMGMKSTLYAYGLDRRMGDANSPSGRVKGSGCIVELYTDEGLTGLGLGGNGVRPQMQGMVDQLLVGQDPAAGAGLVEANDWQAFQGRSRRADQRRHRYARYGAVGSQG